MSEFSSLRTMALAMLLVPVLVSAVTWFILGDTTAGTAVHLRSLAIVAAAVLVASVLLATVGYRVRPFRQGIPAPIAVTRGARSFTSSAFVRMALCQIPMFVGLGLGFSASSGGVPTCVLGAAATLLLLAVHCVPSPRQVLRIQRSLERRGARVPLLEAFTGHLAA